MMSSCKGRKRSYPQYCCNISMGAVLKRALFWCGGKLRTRGGYTKGDGKSARKDRKGFDAKVLPGALSLGISEFFTWCVLVVYDCYAWWNGQRGMGIVHAKIAKDWAQRSRRSCRMH
jgi:hypothetical protein